MGFKKYFNEMLGNKIFQWKNSKYSVEVNKEEDEYWLSIYNGGDNVTIFLKEDEFEDLINKLRKIK